MPTEPSILELLLNREDSGSSVVDYETLIDALESLTPVQQEVLNALFWEGLSQRQVAARLNTYRSGIVRIRDAALAQLRAKLS